MQVLTMTVPAFSEVIAEIGSFMYMNSGMETKVELTLCSTKGCSEGWKRTFGGESCVKVLLTNNTNEQGYIGLTPNFPAKIIPIKFGTQYSISKQQANNWLKSSFYFVWAPMQCLT